MRISEETRYPHPVLARDTGDFTTGEFDMDFIVRENLATGALTIEHSTTLTEDSIRNLVKTGEALVGCFVRCTDTYYAELRKMAWPCGCSDFAAGTLINRVTLRPMVWLKGSLRDWAPANAHPEFPQPINLGRGAILAVGEEQVISVVKAKLAPFESIFELTLSPNIPEGTFQVDIDQERITILADEKTHGAIMRLRGQADGKHVVMNSIYLPAVMEVLDALQNSAEGQYEARRWHGPFIARCDVQGVDPNADGSILENAQKLLDGPARGLVRLMEEL